LQTYFSDIFKLFVYVIRRYFHTNHYWILMTINQKKKLSIGSVIAAVILLGFVFVYSAFIDTAKVPSVDKLQVITSPYIPQEVSFCGETVPVDYFDVFESLEKELLINTYYHSQTTLYIKKSGRFFPIIEPILARYNVPEDLKYLTVAESGLENCVSPVGARGFWQILKGTAEEYGLEVSNEVDERYHLEKSTEAACKYFLDSYKQYNSWTMVAASYNAGRSRVNRQIAQQGEEVYYNLMLDDETARYVFRIIAIKLVMEHPENYGFKIPKNEYYEPYSYKIISVSDSIADLAEFAQVNGINYKMLKYLNPWLRDNKLSNPERTNYAIKIATARNR
jgi:membrane-bound lytic murein transglycosylase D